MNGISAGTEHGRQFIIRIDRIIVDDIIHSPAAWLFRHGPHKLTPSQNIRRIPPLQCRCHVAIDEIDIREPLPQRIIDDADVDMEEMLHTAREAFDAARPFGQFLDDTGYAVDHHLFQIAFDQIFIRQRHHGEPSGTIGDFIGR